MRWTLPQLETPYPYYHSTIDGEGRQVGRARAKCGWLGPAPYDAGSKVRTCQGQIALGEVFVTLRQVC
jgi:hypothetical protein